MLNERLMRQLKEVKENIERSVTRNGVDDFAQYKFRLGQINGLDAAINICREVFKGENNDEL